MTLTIRPAPPGTIDDTPAKRFICGWPGCNHAYVRRTILRNHIEAVHKQITHICSGCGQEFRYKNDLKQHQKRVHDKIRPFVCRVEDRNQSTCACGRRYATRSELNRHQRANPINDNSHLEVVSVYRGHKKTIDADLGTYQTDGYRGVALRASTNILCRPPAQLGPLQDLESAVIAVHSYVIGSIECGNWIVKETHCQSIKLDLPESSVQFNYLNQMKSISAALDYQDFRQARVQLNRTCQTTQRCILGEDPEFLGQVILFGLKMYASGAAQGTCFRRTYDLLTEYIFSLSKTAHGATHPWTMVMKIMLEQRGGISQFETILIMLRALQGSYEHQLGADNLINLWLRLHVARQMDDAPSRVCHLLNCSDAKYGCDSWMSQKCVKELLTTLYDRGDYDAVEKELLCLESRLNHFKDRATHITWEYEIWKWQHNLYRTLQDWDRDVAIVSEKIIPRGVALFGQNDERVSTWLVELERALEKSGQWDRLQATRAYRLSILERLEAEDAEEGHRR